MNAVPAPQRFDLIAVGGGLAGLTAAFRTLELGGRALVLEARPIPSIFARRASTAASSISRSAASRPIPRRWRRR